MLASHALALVGVPMRRVIRVVQDQRDARYSLLRGYFRGADDDTAQEHGEVRLSTLTLPEGGPTVGQALALFSAALVNVRIVSLRSSSGKLQTVSQGTLLKGGDTLVLSGTPEALAIAEERLLR